MDNANKKCIYVYRNYKEYCAGYNKCRVGDCHDKKAILIYDSYSYKYFYPTFNHLAKIDSSFKPLVWHTNIKNINHRCLEISKEEFIIEFKKRYEFLYENYLFLLAPLVKIEDIAMYEGRKRDCQKYGIEFTDLKQIYLGIDIYMLALVEDFLFFYRKGENGKIENHPLYRRVKALKRNKCYLEEYNRGINLLEEDKNRKGLDKIDLSLFDLLTMIRSYIKGQEQPLKSGKLQVLDEYFCTFRYSNDGKVWTSGYTLSRDDEENHSINRHSDPLGNKIIPVFSTVGPGVVDTPFIKGFFQYEKYFFDYPVFDKAGNSSMHREVNYRINRANLSEKDKQDLYLKFHDELPWDLTIKCSLNEQFSFGDSCGKEFKVLEDEIFSYEDSFYQLCSGCGSIVKIPNELLKSSIQERIKKRSEDDEFLVRKKVLLSELESLGGFESVKSLVKRKNNKQ